MELHPDRNFGNVEETTKLFTEVQSAYEVLSDPQERAWYDSHRNAILRYDGETHENHYEHNVRLTSAEDILHMSRSVTVNKDFSDSPSGFFATVRGFFDTLAREEELVCEWEDLDPVSYPSFGGAADNYETMVRPFYAVWTGFATSKTYSWEDLHQYSDAPDRRIRRMMEKENKRFRDEAIHDFNNLVRSFVGFVKKRDPRFKPKKQSDEERQTALRSAAAAQAARSRAANMARFVQLKETPDRKKSDAVNEDDNSNEKKKVIAELVECVVCKKTFKSEKQYEAHEKSNKHIRAVAHIRRQMQKEDKSFQLRDNHISNASQPNGGGTTGVNQSEDDDPLLEQSQTSKNSAKLEGQTSGDSKFFVENVLNRPTSILHECEGPTGSLLQTPDAEHALRIPSSTDDGIERFASSFVRPSNSDSFVVNRANNSMTVADEAETPISSHSRSSYDDEYAPQKVVEERVLGEVDTTSKIDPNSSDVDELTQRLISESLDPDGETKAQAKVGKAKKKRARRATPQTAVNVISDTEVIKAHR